MKLGFSKTDAVQDKPTGLQLEVDDLVGVMKQGIGRAIEHLHQTPTDRINADFLVWKLTRMLGFAQNLQKALVQLSTDQGTDQPRN